MNSIVFLIAVWLASAAGGEITVETERNVAVPMRDGVVLRADVHRPSEGGTHPVLVMRTPYGKGGGVNAFVKAGYIVATQDARGRYESDGKWESFVRFDTGVIRVTRGIRRLFEVGLGSSPRKVSEGTRSGSPETVRRRLATRGSTGACEG